MLIETFDLEEDPARRFVRYAMHGIVAVDPDSGATLRAGQGRRKLGSKRRYFLWGPASLLPAGHFDQTQLGTVTGYNAREALAAANRRLPRLLERLHFRQDLVDRIRLEEQQAQQEEEEEEEEGAGFYGFWTRYHSDWGRR